MPFRAKPYLLIVAIAAALLLSADIRAASDVLWLDFDMKNIPEPKESQGGFYYDFFREQLFEEAKQDLDIPRWFRALVGHPKPAMNVNAVDEVPDSSWYTNRHHLRRMSIDELARGPNQSDGPDLIQATITKAKNAGVTPGMQVKDRKGDVYFIKFDNADYPELQSAAEVISTKIFYAAGYNVPENYIAYVEPDRLQIKEGLEITDASKKTRLFTREDLSEMLKRVAKMPDGRYRVLASRMLPGKPKGPFSHIGIRRDDPNDLIPHEHRRELRGLRVIASWINHWDVKEDNGLDMYVEEHGRKFLRHYLIDFGSDLGAGQHPTEYFRSREFVFDAHTILKEITTLGFYVTPDEKEGAVISPEVGTFSANDFNPENWRTTYPVMPFQNMTPEDAFWATRIILSFTEPELRKIVEAGDYTDPRNTEYVLRTLLERRRMVAGHWLRPVNPIAYFSVENRADGMALTFHDLMADSHLADQANTEYVYRIEGKRYKSEEKATKNPFVLLDGRTLGAALENSSAGGPIAIRIRTIRAGTDRDAVTVYLFPKPNGLFTVGRISRG